MGDALITPAGTPLAPIIVHRYLYIFIYIPVSASRSPADFQQFLWEHASQLRNWHLRKKKVTGPSRQKHCSSLRSNSSMGGHPLKMGPCSYYIYIYIFSFSLSSPALWGGAHETLVLKRKGDTPDTNNCSKNFLLQASYNLMRLCMTQKTEKEYTTVRSNRNFSFFAAA